MMMMMMMMMEWKNFLYRGMKSKDCKDTYGNIG